MTTGGGTIAFVINDGFDSIPGTPTYYRPGRNPSVTELSLQNELQRLRTEDNEEAVDSIAGNFEGAFNIEYSMSNDTHTNVRSIVFNNGGAGFISSSIAPTSTWYVSAEYFDTSDTQNTVEFELRACIPLSYEIRYEQETNTIRESLNLAFGDMKKNTSVTPSSVTEPSDGSEGVFSGLNLTVGGSPVEREQAVTLTFDGPLYRYIRESDRNPATGVLAEPTTSLESTVVYYTDDNVGYALGGTTGATSPQQSLDQVSNSSIDFETNDGTTIATYTLPELKLDSWSAGNIAAADADFEGTANWQVTGGISVS